MDYSLSLTVAIAETFKVEMPADDFMPISSGQFGMGIHIPSDVNISVYALKKRVLSADAEVIWPTNALESDFSLW